jgi:4-alpha-glucanotransferase
VGRAVNEKDVHLNLIRLVYASVAAVAIIPMQDVLGLDERARINTPASIYGNWTWRLKRGDLRNLAFPLAQWTIFFNRKRK